MREAVVEVTVALVALAVILGLVVLKVHLDLRELRAWVDRLVPQVQQVHREVKALQVVVAALEIQIKATATIPATTTATTPARGKDTTND